MKKHGMILFIVLFMAACSRPPEETIPEGIIPPDSMVQILADVHLADAAGQAQFLSSRDTQLIRSAGYFKAAFEKHHISIGDFRKNYAWYSRHPGRMSEMYEEVINELSRRQARMTGH